MLLFTEPSKVQCGPGEVFKETECQCESETVYFVIETCMHADAYVCMYVHA